MSFTPGQAIIRRAGSYTHDVIGQGDVTGLVAALAAKATPADITTAVSAEASARTSAIAAAIAAIIDSAPGVWDTLGEIAAQLSTDESAVGALTAALALKAPLSSPTLTGTVTIPTVAGTTDSTTKAASTAFVQAVVAAIVAGVASFNGRTGAVVPASGDYATADITGLVASLALKAALASPALTGTPTAPTPSASDNSTKLATTAYVDTADALKAALASPVLTGNPTAPTATVGDNDTSIATTAFVQAAITAIAAGVTSFNTRSGAVVPVSGDYATADITGLVASLALKAALASPALTGTPTAPTASPADNSTKLATTAYADAIAALKANLASPTFTGTPAAPTVAGTTDNTTTLATTAFVQAVAALLAPLASPALTGNPTVPTQAVANSSTRAASTAFVGANHPAAWGIQGLVTGAYYTGEHSTTATTTWANGRFIVYALCFAKQVTIDQVAFEVVTTAGGTGSVHRVGIYADNGSGYPGALVKDCGTVATTTTGTKTIAVSPSLVLGPGVYWIGAVQQAAPTPVATLRYCAGTMHNPMIGASAPGTITSAVWTYDILSGVTGALPDPFTAATAPGTAAPRVWIRGA